MAPRKPTRDFSNAHLVKLRRRRAICGTEWRQSPPLPCLAGAEPRPEDQAPKSSGLTQRLRDRSAGLRPPPCLVRVCTTAKAGWTLAAQNRMPGSPSDGYQLALDATVLAPGNPTRHARLIGRAWLPARAGAALARASAGVGHHPACTERSVSALEEGWGNPGVSGAQRRTLSNARGQRPPQFGCSGRAANVVSAFVRGAVLAREPISWSVLTMETATRASLGNGGKDLACVSGKGAVGCCWRFAT